MYEIKIEKPHKNDLTIHGFTKYIQIHPEQNVDSLLKYGFTNFHKPTLYLCRMVDEYITFNLSVNKQTMKITKMVVLQEQFLQPFDYQAILTKDKHHPKAKRVYYQVNELLSTLQNDGIISGFRIGMYV